MNTSQPSLSDEQELVTVQISLDQPQLVHLTADVSIYANSTRAATCTTDFCTIGITIWNADTNQKISPMAYGAFFRVTDDFAAESLAISVVVPPLRGRTTTDCKPSS